MKKLITSLFILMSIVFVSTAQTAWNQIRLSNVATAIVNQDTSYVSVSCRNGKYQALGHSALTGRLKALALPAAYDAGDSVTWRIVKGAAVGTSPRVRFINVRSGQYLYIGTKGGTANIAYMAPREDPNNGIKDLVLNDQGVNGTSYYYYIRSANLTGNPSLYNDITDSVNIKTGDQGWKFTVKKGPQPKVAMLPTPTLALNSPTTTLTAGGSIDLNVQVTKGANDLLGTTSLYYGATLLTTLSLDAQGKASYTYNGLVYGDQKFTVVYSGDVNYEPEDFTLTVTAGPSANAKAVNVTIIPAKTLMEVHNDNTVTFSVKDKNGDPVSAGTVNVLVNGNIKNSFTPDVLGAGSITFPGLLPGNVTIGAKYIGDKMTYLDSDTAKVSVEVTPSTSSVVPYPVYFDLGTIPEIMKYRIKYLNGVTTRTYVKFAADSCSSIALATDTTKLTKTYYPTWEPQALSYTSTDLKDYSCSADRLYVPFGNGVRPSWFSIKTPWLNKGSYNIYLSQRTNQAAGMGCNVTLDGKAVYFPNAEFSVATPMIRSYNGNNTKQWSARGHNSNLTMHYFGTVNISTSDAHVLKFAIANAYGETSWLDMIEFIPVDQDSVKFTEKASVGLAKVYYPLFDLGGYARQAGATVVNTYSLPTDLSLNYQVADPTVYLTKPYTVKHLSVSGSDASGVDYIVVFKKDKWTRVAEGAVITTDSTFTCELPDGDYYYQEYNYSESTALTGAYGVRRWLKEGTFTIGNVNSVSNAKSTNIRTYAVGNTITVKGIKAGAKVVVSDLMGRVIENAISTSDVFATKMLNRGTIYIVKVVSANDNSTTKVLVK